MADIYDTAFRTVLNDCSGLIIPLINISFGEHYTENEQIEFFPMNISSISRTHPMKKGSRTRISRSMERSGKHTTGNARVLLIPKC